MPPGYKDNKKEEVINEHKVNGDYIIFASIIRLSKKLNKNVIFITNDNKEDWYDVTTQNIRYELKKEFFLKTDKKIELLNNDKFIKIHNKIMKNKEDRISKETKKELIDLNNNKLYSSNNGIYKTMEIFTNLHQNFEIIEKLQENLNNSAEIVISLDNINKYFENLQKFNKNESNKNDEEDIDNEKETTKIVD